jgi:cytochrome d ubiquinol oxidase subunit I
MRTSESLAPVAAPAVAASLITFIVVYFFVFGAGTFYIFCLMGVSLGGRRTEIDDGPIRTAGITSAPQMKARRTPTE